MFVNPSHVPVETTDGSELSVRPSIRSRVTERCRMSSSVSRRRLLRLTEATAAASGTGPFIGSPPAPARIPAARADIGVAARPFGLGQVRRSAGRWLDNQNRTEKHLRFVDGGRLLSNLRADNHRLSTNDAAATGCWDTPTFPFRTHVQGRFLTARLRLYAVAGDTTCRAGAAHMVAEPARCQADNGAAGFNAGYLSGYPDSASTALEPRTTTQGNMPYDTTRTTLAGLLASAGWVDWRTGRLGSRQTQAMLGTESAA